MEILPILLGGGMNSHGMALAFYEMGVETSIILDYPRTRKAPRSNFLEQISDARMKTDEGRLAVISEIVNKNKGKRLFLIGCADEYASFLIRCREALPDGCIIPAPRPSSLRYADKAAFASVCEVRGIPTPATVYLRGDEAVPASVPFSYPIVLKPSLGEEYCRHPFDGMQRVWFPRTAREAEGIRRRIRGAGYHGTLLLQERLATGDSDSYSMTAYSNQYGQVCAVAFGRVLLADHTPRSFGTPVAVLTMAPPPICQRVISFLNGIGFCGFSNFDFVRPKGSDKYYALEMNLHQGQCNHFLTAAGVNPAGLLLRDYVLGGAMRPTSAAPDVFWHSVPPSVIYSRLNDGALAEHLRALVRMGRASSPFHSWAEGGPLWHRLLARAQEMRAVRRALRVIE